MNCIGFKCSLITPLIQALYLNVCNEARFMFVDNAIIRIKFFSTKLALRFNTKLSLPKEIEMAEEIKKEAWLNYLALTTVIFAVCATLSTFKGGGFSTKSVINQAQASDEWAYFQSKSIKSYIYQVQAEKLELDLMGLQKNSNPKLMELYTNKISEYKNKIEKYEKEKSDAQEKAKQLEAFRDEAQIHSKAFGLAVIYLQIAILLSSIAGLLKKKVVWLAGIAFGSVGLVYFADGFLVFL